MRVYVLYVDIYIYTHVFVYTHRLFTNIIKSTSQFRPVRTPRTNNLRNHQNKYHTSQMMPVPSSASVALSVRWLKDWAYMVSQTLSLHNTPSVRTRTEPPSQPNSSSPPNLPPTSASNHPPLPPPSTPSTPSSTPSPHSPPPRSPPQPLPAVQVDAKRRPRKADALVTAAGATFKAALRALLTAASTWPTRQLPAGGKEGKPPMAGGGGGLGGGSK